MPCLFSSLWDNLTIYNTTSMILFAIRVVVVTFVAVRLIYHYNKDNLPPKASLLALNLIRPVFIFVSLVFHGPALLNHKHYQTVPGAVVIIIILFLTSFKEYPQNLQKSGAINVTNITVARHGPAGNVNTVVGHISTGV